MGVFRGGGVIQRMPEDSRSEFIDDVVGPTATADQRARLARALDRILTDDADAGLDVDAAWHKTIADEMSRTSTHAQFNRNQLLRIAAVILVVMAGGLLWRLANGQRSTVTIAAPATSRMSATLPDGSRILLAPGSVVSHSKRFLKNRSVELEGSAFFSVTHDTAHPFRVNARNTETRVLGTEFIVDAWPTASAVRVSVQQGRVQFRAQSQVIVLAAGFSATFEDGRMVTGSDQDVAGFDATQSRLMLENVRLDQSLITLERWLGVQITLTDAQLGERRITASLPLDSPQVALEAIGIALGVDIRTNGRRVFIGQSGNR